VTPIIKSLSPGYRKRIIQCVRCGHVWLPMQNVCIPSACPACKSTCYLRPRYPELTCVYCGFKWAPRKANPKVCPKCHRLLEKYLKKNKIHEIHSTKFQILRDALTRQFLFASRDWHRYIRSIRLTDEQVRDITYCLKHLNGTCHWEMGYFGCHLANLPTLDKQQAKIALKLILRFGYSRKLGNEMLAAGGENITGEIQLCPE
jgi:predicted Zn-ribbon and HTH transcriptional regulator